MYEYQSTIVVFKEVVINNKIFYCWYRAGNEDEEFIMPIEPLLSEHEHWEKFYTVCS